MSTMAAADVASVVAGSVAVGGPADSSATGSPSSSSGVPTETGALPSATPLLPQPVLLPVVLPPLPEELVSVCCRELENGIVAVLGMVHPDTGIQRRALPAFARICNRLAHMQLLGADLNNGRVELYAPVNLGELLKHHRSESTKAVTKYKSGQETGGLQLRMPIAERWVREYHELHPESTLQIDSASCIQLLASIEYFLAEFLELGGNAARDNRHSSIDVSHLCLVILNDEELLILCNYMRQPFEADTCPLFASDLAKQYTPIVREIQQERRDRDYARQRQQAGARDTKMQRVFPRYTPVLQIAAEIFASNEPHLRTLLSTCWYHDPARVAHYAQLYARGELKSPVSDYFASFGIRPMAFYGHARRATLASSPADARSFCSFELWDPASRLWWPFVLSVRRSHRHPVFNLALAVNWMHVCQGHLTVDDPNTSLSQLGGRGIKTLIGERRTTLPTFGPKRTEEVGANQLAAAFTSDAASDAAASLIAFASSSSSSPPRDAPAVRPLKFSAILSAALLLGGFDRFGPTLYSSNHPLRARVAFTAAALDVASAAASLPTLPTVLLDLIGEYAPTDLPYIAETSAAGEASAAPLSDAVRAARSALSAPLSERDCLPVDAAESEPQSDRSHDSESELLDEYCEDNDRSLNPATAHRQAGLDEVVAAHVAYDVRDPALAALLNKARVLPCAIRVGSGCKEALVSLPGPPSDDPLEFSRRRFHIVWQRASASEPDSLRITDDQAQVILFEGCASERHLYRGESVYFITIEQKVNALSAWLAGLGVPDCEQPQEPPWSRCPPYTVQYPDLDESQQEDALLLTALS